jgi:tetratricopeptide (TPR) repeat protein
MTAPGFAELVGRLVESMGQQLGAVREVPEGLLLLTSDGFLFAFLEDPDRVSLGTIDRLFADVKEAPARLVVLAPTRLPLALGTEVVRRQGTLVDGSRFHELVRGLGLGSYLGDEPPTEPRPTATRRLPSAQQLDEILRRAAAWQEWGVPALALRFYRQASTLKPEFLPARVGIGRALLALGLTADADRVFDEVLAAQPSDREARIGKASVLGVTGKVEAEIAAYRTLLAEDPGAIGVRAHLVAALIAQKHWALADTELTTMLRAAPEDPQLRFLHGVALERLDRASAGAHERAKARELGLDAARERALCEHLGLPLPTVPVPPVAKPVVPPVAKASAPRTAGRSAGRARRRPVVKAARSGRKAK